LAVEASRCLLACDCLGCLFQCLLSPDLIYQAVPSSSLDSSLEGCQHTFGPHRRFGPFPSWGDFSAPFSFWHSGQGDLRWWGRHVFTFLPPLADTAFPCSLATMAALTPAPLPSAPARVSFLRSPCGLILMLTPGTFR